MFSCEFCEISQNTFFTEPLLTTPSLYTSMPQKTLCTKLIAVLKLDGHLWKKFIFYEPLDEVIANNDMVTGDESDVYARNGAGWFVEVQGSHQVGELIKSG